MGRILLLPEPASPARRGVLGGARGSHVVARQRVDKLRSRGLSINDTRAPVLTGRRMTEGAATLNRKGMGQPT
jgi:hypothetical protein